MRNQCLRLLLLRCRTQSQPSIFHFTHPRASHVTPQKPFFPFRQFTSSSTIEPTILDSTIDSTNQTLEKTVTLSDIFAEQGKTNEEIKVDLVSNNLVISHDSFVKFLRDSSTDVSVAKRVFNFVLECENEKLSSKSFNYMLGLLGANGLVKECWDLIDVMRKRGFGVHKGAFTRISEKFGEEGVEKLKALYASGSISGLSKESEEDKVSGFKVVSDLIKSEVWGSGLEKKLRDLGVGFGSELVGRVLGELEAEGNKGLIFFRWVEESGLFVNDERTYNKMAVALSGEVETEKFWRFVNEMRSKGFEMERETYVKVLGRFVEGRLIGDAVELYEFAMIGEDKPSVKDCNFLLKKIVVSKELDMGLFLKVVKIFKASGNKLTSANLDAVLKSLTSVGRMTECNKILEALEEGGYLPDVTSRRKVAFKLSSTGKKAEATEFVAKLSASRGSVDPGMWVSLVKGYCVARDLKGASGSLRGMVEDKGASSAGHALDLLIRTYCQKNKPFEAYKLISAMVKDKGVSPWCDTYKVLTRKLLDKKRLQEALDVVEMMKNQGYAPDLDLFIGFLSKTGTAEDAVTVVHSMTSKKFPGKPVYLRLIDAYLQAGRQSEAQDFLALCPSFIRNSADVLNRFCLTKSKDVTESTAVAV